MQKHLFRPLMGFMLSALLTLSVLPATALAAQTGSTILDLTSDHVTLDEDTFEYTGEEIRPNVTVRVDEELLTMDTHYTLSYSDNVEVGEGKITVTGIATSGYMGQVELPFYITEKTPEYVMVTLKDEHVTINGTEFAYTGEPVEPAVTVTIDGKTLTPVQDYAVEYINNLVPGTGTVIVRGIATASETLGYTGEIRKDFTILPIAEDDKEEDKENEGETETPSPIEIKKAHVKLEKDTFLHTGKPIEPAVTVTVDGVTLTEGKDYSLKYEHNTKVGTAAVIITGEGSYTGTVKQTFTIEPRYAITEGDGAAWSQKSGETLSFTINAEADDFDHLTVNGKTLAPKYYSVKSHKDGTVITLKTSFLNQLDVETYDIVFHFVDGEAEGTFRVSPEADDSNPKTGDTFPLHLLSAVMFVSLTGMIGAAYVGCKKIRK